MAEVRILLIGGSRAKNEAMMTALEKRYNVVLTPSGKQGVMIAKTHLPHVVVLDAISLRTPGDRLCQMLRAELGKRPIVHLHPGPQKLVQSPADVVLVHPFTPRKLINNIERLLAIGNEEIIRCGPFTMNVERRILLAHGQEKQLTPKQALLIETFLRSPGQVLERKTLMEKVWDTDYLGDTRTLDVHIRWIRKALAGENTPNYLKTIRGVGYRLEV